MKRSSVQDDRGLRAVFALNSILGLSQQEIADRIGVSFSTVNAWASGRRQPRSAALATLESALRAAAAERAATDRVRAVAALLHLRYGSPNLNNKPDPLDELFFILLSLKTSHLTYENTYEAFRDHFHPWSKLLHATPDQVESLIRRGGLGSVKARAFTDIAKRLQHDFGRVSMDALHGMATEEAEDYLRSLPGVGIKTARCVLMYALGREVLPVDTHTYRVGLRLGLVGTSRSLRNVHAAFEAAVPPDLRHAIHTNFVAHGREVCKDPAPECGRCPVTALCKQFETGQAAALAAVKVAEPPPAANALGVVGEDSRKAPTAIDLYAGCGGLSAGLREAGFDVAYALDWDRHACATHEANFPEAVLQCADVREVSGAAIRDAVAGPIDLVAGGPNCQGVSERGLRSPDDPRNYMFPEFVRLVSELRPAVFLMENVPGLTHRHNYELLKTIFSAFNDLGYRCAGDVLLAADYGVPQLRYRFFLVGTRLDAEITLPQPTRGAGGVTPLDLPPYVTVDEAIGDLPTIEATRQSDEPMEYACEPDNDFQTYARKGSELAHNHLCAATDDINLRRAAWVPEGGNWKDIPAELLPDRFFMSRMTDHSTTYARLRRDQPAFTITALFGNITAGAFTHPVQTRALSVREGARLQSFRDSFVFRGPRNSQYRQIGNAVPPLLAAAVGRHLMALLSGGQEPGRKPRVTDALLADKRAWDALPVLTPRFRALFGSGTRWPRGWGAEPKNWPDKLDGNYSLRREYWPDGLRSRSRKPPGR